MDRVPVTSNSFMADYYSGKSMAKSGKITKKANVMGGVNFGWNLTSGIGGMSTSAYNTSYANMGQSTGAFGDVPLYFALMNENNGGILYWPVTLKEKYSWYRYFARVDPFVKRAIEFHTDLPMSKLILRMPKMEDKKLRDKILRKYEGMTKRIKLFERLHSMLYESNILGNCFIFCEWNEEKKEWAKLTILPPEELVLSKFPMSDNARVMYRPELLYSLVRRYNFPVDSYESYIEYVQNNLTEEEQQVFENVSYEFIQQLLLNNGSLMMDTDPFSGDGEENMVGSFCFHFSEKRHDYYDLGVSPLECVLIPLLMKEHFKYTQLSLASRNMTPRNKITAPDIGEEALAMLREQVDLSMLNPDYTIVTNYDWSWDLIGANDRLIDLSKENEYLDEQFYAGLGITKEILTGEGMYSGSKVTVELMNTKYLFKREALGRFVEESLFLPMAEEWGFYETDEWGNKTYFYPHLSFTRLSIRDNAEVFDSLFQLYLKGSIPIDVILDLFNLDSDEIHEKLKQDQFTVKDAVNNEMMRGVYSEIATKVANETDLAEQIINSITGPEGKKLTYTPAQQEGEGEFGEGGEGDAGFYGEETPTDEEIVENYINNNEVHDYNFPEEEGGESADEVVAKMIEGMKND